MQMNTKRGRARSWMGFYPLLYPCMPSRRRPQPQPSRPPFAPTVEQPAVKVPSVPAVAFPTEAPPLEVTNWTFVNSRTRNQWGALMQTNT
eukprot:scaffold10579_cov308-Chaetoceros_neogracile.AAC.1